MMNEYTTTLTINRPESSASTDCLAPPPSPPPLPHPPPLPLFLSSFPNDAIDANDAIEIIRVITKRKKQVPAIRRSYPFFLF